MTQKLFTNWTRNLGDQLKSKQSSESADGHSEGPRSSSQRKVDQEESEDPEYVPLIRKGKRQIEEIHQSTEEMSQGSAALPFSDIPLNDQPPKKKHKQSKKAGKVSEHEPQIAAEEMAGKVVEPEPQEEMANTGISAAPEYVQLEGEPLQTGDDQTQGEP